MPIVLKKFGHHFGKVMSIVVKKPCVRLHLQEDSIELPLPVGGGKGGWSPVKLQQTATKQKGEARLYSF